LLIGQELGFMAALQEGCLQSAASRARVHARAHGFNVTNADTPTGSHGQASGARYLP
jgi:hypothetical protein